MMNGSLETVSSWVIHSTLCLVQVRELLLLNHRVATDSNAKPISRIVHGLIQRATQSDGQGARALSHAVQYDQSASCFSPAGDVCARNR